MTETWGFGISYKKITANRMFGKDKQTMRMLTFMFAKWSYSKLWVQEYTQTYAGGFKEGWNPADGSKYKDEVEAQNAHRI